MAALPLSSSSVSPSNKSIPACFLPCFLSKNRVVEAANPWRSPVVDGGGGHGWFDHGSPRFPIFCKQAPLRTNLTARQPWNRFASTDPAEIGGEDADLLQEGALRSESAVARELCCFWLATPVILASLALWAQLARAVPLLGTADPSGNQLMVCSAVPAFKSVFVVAALVDMAFVAMMQVFFGLGAPVVEGNRRWLLGMLQDVVCYAVDEIQIAVVSSSEEFLEDVIRQLWILMVRLLEHFQGGVQRDICKCFCCTSDTRQNDDFSEDGGVLPLGLILQWQMREPLSMIPRSDGRTCLQLGSVMLTTNLQLDCSKPPVQMPARLLGESLKTSAVALCQSSQLTRHQTPAVGSPSSDSLSLFLFSYHAARHNLYLLSL